MALQKTITVPGRGSGNYSRVGFWRWDRETREASAHFHLFIDSAAAASGEPPLRDRVAKLRLTGDKFDQYLAPSVLASAEHDVVAQLYIAAKAEEVVSDFGSNLFADAADV